MDYRIAASIIAVALMALFGATGCSTVGTAAETTGDVAGHTARGAGDVAGDAVEGAGEIIDETAEEADDEFD